MSHATDFTAGHSASIEQATAEWMRVALSTERCDRPAAEAAVRAAYRAAGLPDPPVVVWMDSPFGGYLASWAIGHSLGIGQFGPRGGDHVRDQLPGPPWPELEARLGGTAVGLTRNLVEHQLRGPLQDELANGLDRQISRDLRAVLAVRFRGRRRRHRGDQRWAGLWDQSWEQIRDQLPDQLRDQLPGQLWDQLPCLRTRSHLPFFRSGGESSEWLWKWSNRNRLHWLPDRARDQYWHVRPGKLRNEIGFHLGVQEHFHLGPWSPLGKGYWWVSGEQALGFAGLASPGMQCPQDLIEQGWSAARILAERNTEVRRCAIERLGWDRFVADANLTQVGSPVHDPGNPGAELALYHVPKAVYGRRARVLICRNGTPEPDGRYHRFGLLVPADMPDPLTAAAWTYDLSPSDYQRLQRRS